MNSEASKYLNVETSMSGLCNGILNLAAGYAIFHSGVIATSGHGGLIQDSIGETFLVTSLSFLIPTLIARHRRRSGTLPVGDGTSVAAGNIYVRAFVVGVISTLVLVPCNAFLLPRIFPEGASLHHAVLWKTIYGAIFGSIATWIALRRALHEVS